MNNFYSDKPSRQLRFGDVVQGYIFVDLTIKKPKLVSDKSHSDYNIQVSYPQYCVVLTPCCSIEKKCISICPLEQIKSNFLKNNYFKNDLTRINLRMKPENAFTDEGWNKKGKTEQANLMSESPKFALLQNFIYAPNDLFETYNLRTCEIKHYMIDFKNAIKIKCELIDRKTPTHTDILSSKVAELSIETRRELIEKLTNFYRVPDEDKIENH